MLSYLLLLCQHGFPFDTEGLGCVVSQSMDRQAILYNGLKGPRDRIKRQKLARFQVIIAAVKLEPVARHGLCNPGEGLQIEQ